MGYTLAKRSTTLCIFLTVFIVAVQSLPVRDSKPCPDDYVNLSGDCVPSHIVRQLKNLLCDLSSHLHSRNPLSGLGSFCPEDSEEKRHLNEAMDAERRHLNEWMGVDQKRAWWHSGLKPERR